MVPILKKAWKPTVGETVWTHRPGRGYCRAVVESIRPRRWFDPAYVLVVFSDGYGELKELRYVYQAKESA